MDKIIKDFNFERKNGLNYCQNKGVAYQSDMSISVDYDKEYFKKYLTYETTSLGAELNKQRYLAIEGYTKDLPVIDIGIGCGSFIKYALEFGLNIYGYDINPYGVHWLNKNALYADIYNEIDNFKVFLFWDSLEHISEPHKILNNISLGSYVFISMPIFNDLESITKSKHYRPNEHYYYFTNGGLIRWMAEYNFKFIKAYDFEEKAGREDIKSFLFEKVIFTAKDNFKKLYRDYISTVEGDGHAQKFNA